MFQKGCVLQCKIDSLFKNRVNYNTKLVIFQKHCVLQWTIDVFRGAKNIVKHSTFEMCGSKTTYFTMNLEDSENQSSKWSQFDWFSKNIQKHLVFDDFLLQKAVSVDSFTKMGAKCLRPGFGLGRAGWAGLGWLGWPGLGWLGWLGCLGLWARVYGPLQQIIGFDVRSNINNEMLN